MYQTDNFYFNTISVSNNAELIQLIHPFIFDIINGQIG